MARDPYSQAAFSRSNRLGRALWQLVYVTLFRMSPRPAHAWRALLLKMFGARLGHGCHIYPKAVIWAPWNLLCEDVVAIADEAVVYNPSPISLGSHCTISQQAYLCGATHDYNDPAFTLTSAPIIVGPYAWVCARATVLAGAKLGEGSVLGLGSVTSKDLEPWSVYAGMPARKIAERKRHP